MKAIKPGTYKFKWTLTGPQGKPKTFGDPKDLVLTAGGQIEVRPSR